VKLLIYYRIVVIIMAGGLFLLEKAGGSLVIGGIEAAEGQRAMGLMLVEKVMVGGYRMGTLV
jgi:hypothetical protein